MTHKKEEMKIKMIRLRFLNTYTNKVSQGDISTLWLSMGRQFSWGNLEASSSAGRWHRVEEYQPLDQNLHASNTYIIEDKGWVVLKLATKRLYIYIYIYIRLNLNCLIRRCLHLEVWSNYQLVINSLIVIWILFVTFRFFLLLL